MSDSPRYQTRLDIDRRLDELEAKVNAIVERDLDRRSAMDQMRGHKERLDRILGTVTDLQARFDAWKDIGNKMGEQVNALSNTVVAHHDAWGSQAKANAIVREFIITAHTILTEMRNIMVKQQDAILPNVPTLEELPVPEPRETP